MDVPPRIANLEGSSGPRGEESQFWQGARRTRVCEGAGEEGGEDGMGRTRQQASLRRGVVKEGEG